ncbi:hypothetical protein [Bacteroides salyersiae]|jgi:hypothetical protein|uniref:hypothetical protein n=1 Tax=Bacteroides salyersiae TaxID=291644 RepID=UPI002166A944|nr:hypothetical protein [Bacteroides salyersiae]MCS3060315.1 hypothetical protein [Bacteroides salyersiae]
MYFPLAINEQLADMLRTATELSVQINAYIKNDEEFNIEEFPSNVISDASESITKIITDLGDVIGRDIVNQAIYEEEKEIKNRLNPESHVSK